MRLYGVLLTQGLTLQVLSPRKFYKLLSVFLTCQYSVELTGLK